MTRLGRDAIQIPAKAGTHAPGSRAAVSWIPAFAGITKRCRPRTAGYYLGWLLFAVTICAAIPAHAVHPDEMLADPVFEARAREVGSELRCLVCRNQSIDDSDADLAHDLRMLVRERIKAGDTNAQVIAYIRSRYGDFVLLRPPFKADTLLLWGGPLLILIVGGVAVARFYRRRDEAAPAPLSAEERRRLAAVLGEGPKR
ncbi:MAG TPA: cytochrome c-type biogenesis protein [Stellaceae bacterium]|nr:cytochrome c-type biogenesis protein [Stellaceae bacterium]